MTLIMKSYGTTLTALTTLLVALSGGIATALTASSTSPTPATLVVQQIEIRQALPGQGSIVGPLLLGSSTSVVLPSLATTTAAGTTTPGLGALSEHNKLGITGACVVTQSSNAKQCDIYVTYTTPKGDPVIGLPVTIRTMNAEGSFVDFDGPLFIKEGPGKVGQYSGILPDIAAVDVATYVGPATATSTLFVVTTPDGLRAQTTFASSTAVQ
jgi:hypothetical protein